MWASKLALVAFGAVVACSGSRQVPRSSRTQAPVADVRADAAHDNPLAGPTAGTPAAPAPEVSPEPDAAPAPCPEHEPGSDPGLDTPALSGLYRDAKRSCDDQSTIGWTCGDFHIAFDGSGCVTDFTADFTNHSDASEFVACMLAELHDDCDRCASSTTRRVYESCTIL